MYLAPFYRNYELPWSPTEEVEQRFRRVVRNVLIVFLIFALLIPFLPVTEKSKSKAPDLPERVVKLVIEKKLPPPPPPPKVEPKAVEIPKAVQPKPQPDKTEQARKRASQAMVAFDQLAALRDTKVLDKVEQTKNLTGAVGEQTRSERALITSKVGAGSGGINNASLSRGYGGGTGSLTGRDTTQVTTTLGSTDGKDQVRRTSGSNKAARSREEIELVFDRNKGAIYALYSRALREHPELKGKVVLQLTITPAGEVTNCEILSSELDDPDFQSKLKARVKLFRFEPRDVEAITTTKPIDFFPAA
jgi:protein TonB